MIVKTSPDAAVIDFMLPDISGLEVCRQVRTQEAAQTTKPVLFTADDQAETEKKALEQVLRKL